MTEPDLPYIKPTPEIPPETNEVTPPSPDVKNPLPNHEPLEKMENEDFICPVCRKTFNTKADLDLHIAKSHGQTTKV
jgi:protein-disulfide isomerase